MDAVRTQPQTGPDFELMLRVKQRLGEKVTVKRDGKRIPDSELEKMKVGDLKACQVRIARMELKVEDYGVTNSENVHLILDGHHTSIYNIGMTHKRSEPALDVLDSIYKTLFDNSYNSLRKAKKEGKE